MLHPLYNAPPIIQCSTHYTVLQTTKTSHNVWWVPQESITESLYGHCAVAPSFVTLVIQCTRMHPQSIQLLSKDESALKPYTLNQNLCDSGEKKQDTEEDKGSIMMHDM